MWAPETRETADHSIPFLVGAALLDGTIEAATFSEERVADPRLRALMQKVQVIHDPELDKLQPSVDPCRMEITLKNGTKKLSNVDYPKGHVGNPASDQDIENKLARMNNGLLSPGRVSALLDACWRLDELDDVRELISATRAGWKSRAMRSATEKGGMCSSKSSSLWRSRLGLPHATLAQNYPSSRYLVSGFAPAARRYHGAAACAEND